MKYPIRVGDIVRLNGYNIYNYSNMPTIHLSEKIATIQYTNTPGDEYIIGNIKGLYGRTFYIARAGMVLLTKEEYPELYI